MTVRVAQGILAAAMKMLVSSVVRGLLAALSFAAFQGFAGSPGELDLSFNPGSGVNDSVGALTRQPDGKVIIGGSFTAVRGALRNYVARLNADGNADLSFDPGTGPDGGVCAVAIDSGNGILIGGGFASVNGIAQGHFARLNPNGSLDRAFQAGSGANSNVLAIAVQLDGRVLIGGDFTSVDGTIHNRIARLNTNGALDSTFDAGSGPNGRVLAIAVQPDGHILIAGAFLTVNGASRQHIARLNGDGSLDTSFTPDASVLPFAVYAIALQTNGQVVLARYVSPEDDPRIPRLNSDGSLDTNFVAKAGLCSWATAVAVQLDGKVLIGGEGVQDATSTDLARLNADGSLDTSFALGTGPDSRVCCILPQPDGKVLIGGGFTTVNGVGRDHVARLNADGSLDTGFNPGAVTWQNLIYTIAPQADDKVIIGGQFTATAGAHPSRNLARLNKDGSLDGSFDAGTGPNGEVEALAVQPDGKLLLAGAFTSINGTVRRYLARLNATGSLDLDFNSDEVEPISSITLLAEGKVLVAANCVDIARLNSDGSFDETFAPIWTWSQVMATAVQADGKVIIGGSDGGGNGNICRLNTNGSKDTNFNVGTGASSPVYAVALQADGKVLVGGYFTTFNHVACGPLVRLGTSGRLDTTFAPDLGPDSSVASIAVQPDGRILVCAGSSTPGAGQRGGIYRLLSDGSPDPAFRQALTDDSDVSQVALQADGKALILGSFRPEAGPPLWRLARLFTTDAPPTFWFDSITRLPDNNVCLAILGDSLSAWRIEASADLGGAGGWQTLGCCTNTCGRVLFSDLSATNSARQFYRATWTPGL